MCNEASHTLTLTSHSLLSRPPNVQSSHTLTLNLTASTLYMHNHTLHSSLLYNHSLLSHPPAWKTSGEIVLAEITQPLNAVSQGGILPQRSCPPSSLLPSNYRNSRLP